MKPIGGDSGLRAKTKLEPVSKTGRCIYINRSRIDLAFKAFCRGAVLRDYCVGQMRTVSLDKGDGFIDRIQYLYGENQVQVLRIPIGLGCGTGIAQHATGPLVSANL